MPRAPRTTLPPERLAQVRQLIHDRLAASDVFSRVEEFLADFLRGRGTGEVSEAELVAALQQRGLVEDVVRSLHLDALSGIAQGSPAKGGRPAEAQAARNVHDNARDINDSKADDGADSPVRRLYVRLLTGKAFLEHVREEGSTSAATLTAHLFLRGQRFRTRAVACVCEPPFAEGFAFDMQEQDGHRLVDATALLALRDPIQLAVVRSDGDGDVSLLGHCVIDWRRALRTGGASTVAAELRGIGAESDVPVGVVDVRLELLPRMDATLPQADIDTRADWERSQANEHQRMFLVYAKQWWREFLQTRPSNASRMVRIFAEDETATNRLACTFVAPLRAGRLLDTPRHAVRFVSLLAVDRSSPIGGGAHTEQWLTLHSLLAARKGDVADHANLLCSLLIGFGLDAYVCIGTRDRGQLSSWVAVVYGDGAVVFWDPVAGQRYVHRLGDAPAHPYRTIGCAFNHRAFYANNQPSDAVDTCRFSLTNDGLWKPMSADAIASLPRLPVPPIAAPTLDAAALSADIESEMRGLLAAYRRDRGFSTAYDDDLAHLLTPALASYELERATGVRVGNEDFESVIRRAVPEGQTFKGFPIQFSHRSTRRMFAACLKSAVCGEIVDCRGDAVRHAVRVRAFAYPEDALAVWVMVAVKYRAIT